MTRKDVVIRFKNLLITQINFLVTFKVLYFSTLANIAKATMWKEDAMTFPETKALNSSMEHKFHDDNSNSSASSKECPIERALSLLEDSPIAEPTNVEPVRPMVTLVKLDMLTEPVTGQDTFVESIFCDLYCADVNKHTEHCVTRLVFKTRLIL